MTKRKGNLDVTVHAGASRFLFGHFYQCAGEYVHISKTVHKMSLDALACMTASRLLFAVLYQGTCAHQ